MFNKTLASCTFFSITLSFTLFNYSLALTPLPQNSYLQYKDNIREVKYLQEILNSSPDTQITDEGPDSPGQENWFFGKLTELAVKKFQTKYTLIVNGKTDFKTLRKLNEVVNTGGNNLGAQNNIKNNNTSNLTAQEKVEVKKNFNEIIYQQNNKKEVANSSEESPDTYNAASKYIEKEKIQINTQSQEQTPNQSATQNSSVSSILDRYTNYFSNKNTGQDINTQTANPYLQNTNLQAPEQSTYSNTYSQKTPYLNQQTGIYSSSPVSQISQQFQQPQQYYYSPQQVQKPQPQQYSYAPPQQSNPYSTSGLPFGSDGPAPAAPFDIQKRIEQLTQSGPQGLGSVNNIGGVPGILPTGNASCGDSKSNSPRLICVGNATKYAHGASSDGCIADKGDQQNDQQPASFSKFKVYLSRVNQKAIPAVALPPIVHRKFGFGTAVEVKEVSSGKCKVFPILDSGPANFVLDRGTVIDLTGSAFDILQGKTPCSNVSNKISSFPGTIKVQYAVNVNGKKLKPGEVGECTMLGNSK